MFKKLIRAQSPYFFISLFLYLISCVLMPFQNYGMRGYVALLFGWLGALGFLNIFFAWLANVLYIIGFFIKHGKIKIILSVLTVFFSLFGLFISEIPENTSTIPVIVGAGTYMWIAAFTTMLIGSVMNYQK